jgi:hypothetical protein
MADVTVDTNQPVDETPLTPDERNELAQLRQYRADQDVAERDRLSFDRDKAADVRTNLDAEKPMPTAEANAEDEPLPDTHWLILADGRKISSKGTMTHYGAVPVLYSTPIPVDPESLVPAHRF